MQLDLNTTTRSFEVITCGKHTHISVINLSRTGYLECLTQSTLKRQRYHYINRDLQYTALHVTLVLLPDTYKSL